MLIIVHIAIAAHLAHWWIAGRTLSPLEPSESMETLRTGLVNAGAIFFSLSILSTLLFGRFFCGWACHMVALQDGCSWLLARVGIRPKPIRTRLLIAVPFIVAFYMFFYPMVYGWFTDALSPEFADAWGRAAPIDQWRVEVIKADFWGTFPGIAMGLFTLFLCGVAIVYFLGAKGFCTYGCPYGAFFAIADRFAPGKIKVDLDACQKCGHCTAACSSNVAVHKEIQAYGKVVDRGCMKCLDCVSVCPNGALSFGFTRPQLASFVRASAKKPKKRYSFPLAVELGLATLAIVIFFAWRGAYGLVPMLLSLGI
ncbi:MAG: 4Fe-4S binding protein, partial [Planctomycetes bacterium]|nr:4Fe-4S binding protein [Planctomycetota bacterium]